MERRQFLTIAAGALAATGFFPDNLQRAMAAPVQPLAALTDIEHVVVFMQENRSFDHYFGLLRGVRGFGDRSRITLPGGKSVFEQPNGTKTLMPFRVHDQCMNGTPHDWGSGHTAWDNGKWDKWVSAKGAATMAYYGPEDLGFYYQLADAFTIMDAYHCSVMGPTCPNRLYLWSGHSGGYTDNSMGEGNPICTWTTYAERLEAASVSWKVYQESNNYDDNGLAYFKQFHDAAPGTALHDKAMVKYPDLVTAFKNDVTAGTLPKVSWVVAPDYKSEHPSWGPNSGALLTSQLLDALASNPAVWNKSVFLLTYDENDGFYDHVPPPVPAPGTPGEFSGGQPFGLGVRVPMIVVSPFSRGGNVSSETSDHTSVLQFLEKVTGVAEPNISAWRRKVTGDLTSTLDLTGTVGTYPALTRPVDPACRSGVSVRPPKTQVMPVQASGTRPARPLPYQPTSALSVDRAAGKVWIALGNAGAEAAHLAVYAQAFRTDGPWQYTVDAHASTSDYFNVQTYGGGKYDLGVFGPNRFLRRFAGDINAAGGLLQVTDEVDPAAGLFWLTLANHGTSAVTFTVAATGYRTDGPWTYPVAAGGSTRVSWNATTGWYDLTVTTASDTAWTQRFLGHIETGAPSITG
ncbi:non-hemolytic phospholipase C [Longispora fulva]|uniref:Phospholipase C n=1 Tax=Longispora fulva TaxID=619741 RepID=A0A8J7GJ43_9ACTN|nr:phospholipase C, phosphocholine-specific [Longispora fulva]MBG6137453.1 phospholipase C [Longispora fulva]GIG61192.1 non-hemolytic phospholipase C [Longispora fulva]